ncbi:protein gamma response 1 [Syzygium oleosum]|uniref:protein gamma response 1 n=1 Tax=Syzygium oleosum TaxID=219896 RepID=UPI0011D2299C|nr:protein gamma response 1 [Syzygium oleosum]
MDKCDNNSPKVGISLDHDDVKYVSGLSTILVATIQEAKDRISQIEYIFCSQLYPNFQSKSRSLQKIYSEAMEAAENTWKENESNLLLRTEKLLLEKQQVSKENQSLRKEMAKLSKEQEERLKEMADEQENRQLKIDELESELQQKTKEIDEGIDLQKKLLQLVQSNASALAIKGKETKEQEEKTRALLTKQENLENMVKALKEEVGKKTEEVIRGKDLQANLMKKMEFQASEVLDREQLLLNCEREKDVMMTRSKCLEEKISELEGELRRKAKEEVGGKLNKELPEKSNSGHLDGMINEKESQQFEERQILLCKVKNLEEKVNELQACLRQKSSDITEGGSEENLLQLVKCKTSELSSERKKKKDLFDAYKRLKSQNNYLRTKLGLVNEDKLPQSKSFEEEDILRCQQNQPTASCLENSDLNPAAFGFGVKVTEEISVEDCLEADKGVEPIKNLRSLSASSKYVASKCQLGEKSTAAVGTKRNASDWRDTRSNQPLGGPDPHDDFLNTPFENVKRNLNEAANEEHQDSPAHNMKEIDRSFSDDETQDMNVDPCPKKQQVVAPSAGRQSFKFVEPVRRKAERENLKGIECRQCKKFYDAVLPDDESKDNDNNKRNFRCEHHDGVSRHRYKYVPPMTPEGFWNIGFESEM